MSLIRIVALVAVVLLLAAGWAWWTSDAQRIHRRLGALTDAVEKGSGESPLAAALAAEAVAGFFAEPFLFRARQFDFETADRVALARTVAGYRLRSERIAAEILHRDLEVDAAARTARMEIVVRFAGGLIGRPGEAYRFRLDWADAEGRWKIAYADLIEIVEPRGP